MLTSATKSAPPTITAPHAPAASTPAFAASDEALDALIALGFPLKEASAALADVDPSLPTAERVRLALKQP